MKPTVISQDTPWGEIPSLLLPAYGETWLMVAIVMLFVVTLGGLVGVVLFNASPRGLFPHALLYRLLNWVVNMGRSLPFLVLMAALNALFNHAGVTMLFYLPNGNPVTREALCYGAAAAAMFAAVILWFQCCNVVMTAEKYLYVFGSALPGVSLLLSMALRFVPKFSAHIRSVRAAQASLGCGTREGSAWQRLRNGARILSVTVSWALESGVTAADSMKSRGYGAGRRTYFGNYRFTRRDGVLSAVLALGLAGVCAGVGCGALYVRYYPSIRIGGSGVLGAVCMACFALLCFLPLLLDGKEALTWRRLRSNI